MLVETLVGAGALAGALGVYAAGVEPLLEPRIRRYRIQSERFDFLRHRNGKSLHIAVIADLHACRLWMDSERIHRIVAQTNALNPDLIVLLGDYVSAVWPKEWSNPPLEAWSAPFSGFQAPLGTFAVLGNHDCRWDSTDVTLHLEKAGIPVLHNRAIELRTAAGAHLWLAGLGDQRVKHLGSGRYLGEDDLAGTMEQIKGETDPLILLAHEPDIFPEVPSRVDLLLSGHTHGGQVRLPGLGTRFIPSRHGPRYVYGHFVEDGRQMIVSGGLGCSKLPIRFRMPPEIGLIEIG
ncbi:MAG: metallophosphoesterase [Pseudomonadota bacterium]